ncbi:MAG: hypothetical protein HeimAB125_14940 [Candidatus Heimdallarchaeota archaeon AB_125]|nr:MAG: hypothetical protein HeimAB125_14940 [Candidatus Heimdallarchaeota archaeon AB_125]
MSNIICSNCGTVSKAEFKFCVGCGSELKGGTQTTVEPTAIRRDNFFCPRCNIENAIENFNCTGCGEDFSKYNIKRSVLESSKSRIAGYANVVVPTVTSKRNLERNILFFVIGAAIFGVLMWVFSKLMTGGF